MRILSKKTEFANFSQQVKTDYDTKAIALAFNYYLTRVIVFKFEYDIVQEGPRKADKSNNVLSLQVAFRF